jgi:hypothetical protein
MLILNMCPFVKLYHSSPGIRKLLLTNQNPLAFNSCSLTYHFTRLILSFQIGANCISIFMGNTISTLLKTKSVFRSLINTSVIWHAIKSNVRGSNKIKMTLLDFYQHDNTSLYSSIESQACLLFVHLNNTRPGCWPMGNTNLYTWAFGLTGLCYSISLKRICDPTFNMIRALFAWL